MPQLGSDEPTHMQLNGAALENLEVLENAEGAWGEAGLQPWAEGQRRGW